MAKWILKENTEKNVKKEYKKIDKESIIEINII